MFCLLPFFLSSLINKYQDVLLQFISNIIQLKIWDIVVLLYDQSVAVADKVISLIPSADCSHVEFCNVYYQLLLVFTILFDKKICT